MFEPGDAGSYDIRLYDGALPKSSRYVCGLVVPRNGRLRGVVLADVDHDGTKEIVVILSSADRKVSANAFKYGNRKLLLASSVSRLDKSDDPVRALSR